MVQPLAPNESYLALDIGDARIGLARAGSIARLPEPLETIQNNQEALDVIKAVIERENIGHLVIGVPRNLSGEESQQSQKIRQFGEKLTEYIGMPAVYVDESLSSKRADEYLRSSKSKAAQDSVAACFILEEFFTTMEEHSSRSSS